jgi:hypothetical protein
VALKIEGSIPSAHPSAAFLRRCTVQLEMLLAGADQEWSTLGVADFCDFAALSTAGQLD